VTRVEALWSGTRWRWAKLLLALYGINLASCIIATAVTSSEVTGLYVFGADGILIATIFLIVPFGTFGLTVFLRWMAIVKVDHRNGGLSPAGARHFYLLVAGVILVNVAAWNFDLVLQALQHIGGILIAKGAYPPLIAVFGTFFDVVSITVTWTLIKFAARSLHFWVSMSHLIVDLLIAVLACCWLPFILGPLTNAPTAEHLKSFFAWAPEALENNLYFLIVGVSASLPTILYMCTLVIALCAHFGRRPLMFIIYRFTTDDTPVLKLAGNFFAGSAVAIGAVRILMKYSGT
jgi:hypothetical protein